MKQTQILGLLLAACMFVSLFAGCAGGPLAKLQQSRAARTGGGNPEAYSPPWSSIGANSGPVAHQPPSSYLGGQPQQACAVG